MNVFALFLVVRESVEVSEVRISANAFPIYLKCAYLYTLMLHRQNLLSSTQPSQVEREFKDEIVITFIYYYFFADVTNQHPYSQKY